MSTPTVVFYGTPGHAALEMLYSALQQRQKCRVAWLIQEAFPLKLDVCMSVGEEEQAGFLIPPNDAPIHLRDIVGVCLDRYYIDARPLSGFEPRDLEYIQTESWATLIALFSQLQSTAVVANHVVLRDHMATRMGELCFLQSHGLEVPQAIVTSNEVEARRFHEALGGNVILRPAGMTSKPFRPMQPDDLERLDMVRNAPVHFEEMPRGNLHSCLVVGDQSFVLPAADVPAPILEGCRAACHKLGMLLGEVTLRHLDGRWMASGLRYFPAAETLSYPAALEAAVALLENVS